MHRSSRQWWMVPAMLLVSCTGVVPEAAAPLSPGEAPMSMVNGSFDQNSLNGWTTTMYSNQNLGSTTPGSFADLALQPGDGTVLTRVVSGPSNSVVPAGLSTSATLRLPLFGSTAAVINELGKNNHASALQQSFVVGPGDFDASDGMVHLRFARAAVLQSPSHAANALPYFFIAMTNASRGNALIYDEFHYANDSTAVWHTDPNTSGVLYTDWQLSDITVSPTQVAIGETLSLSVIAAGCGAGGHFGELYVDGFATQVPGVTIDTHGPSIANPNTNVQYTFEVSNHGTASAPNVTFSIPVPANTTFVSLQTPAGVSCTTPAVGATGTVVCSLGTMAPSALETLALTVFIPAAYTGPVTMTGHSVASNNQPTLLGASLQALVSASAVIADLTTTIAPIPAQCCDQNLAFEVTYLNNGPSAATGVPVTASFSSTPVTQSYSCVASAGASCGGATTISGSGALDSNVDFAAHSQLRCIITGTFPASLRNLVTLTSAAAVTSAFSDSYPNNNAASLFLSTAAQPACTAALPNGHACTTNASCGSGFCVDGVCCNASCQSQCHACDVAGNVGTCSIVDGTAPHGSRTSCGGFVCSQGSCLSSCSSNTQCATEFFCQAQVCVTNERCTHDAECPSGTYCTPLLTCETPRQQRNDDPNWVVQGMGSTSMGCSQSGPYAGGWLAAVIGLVLLRRVRSRRHASVRSAAALLVTGALALGTLVPTPARAADSLSLSASHFQLWGGDEDIWATQSASIPPHLRWGVFAFGNVAHNLVRVVSVQNSSAERSLIRYQEVLDIGATLALARWVELSIAESIVWQQTSGAPFLSTQLGLPAKGFAAGDVRFAPKLRLIDKEKVRLALSVAATFPTGRLNSFVGNGTVTLTPKLLLDVGRRAGLRMMLNAGVLLRGHRQLASDTLHDAFAYALGGALPFHIRTLPAEALFSATGEVGLQKVHAIDVPIEGHLGLRLWPAEELAVDIGGGTGFTNGLGSPRWRVFLGLKGSFGRKPPTRPDRDGDGIPDDEDACPELFGQPSSDPNAHGCPPAAPVVAVAPAPKVAPPPPAQLPGHEPLVAISEVLLFNANQASLTQEDMGTLDKIDAALSEHPEARVSVDGHTDNSGSLARNMLLSKQRSEMAYRWLVSHGIKADRLEPRHFGPGQPRVSNLSADGRRKNRRVEFHLLHGRTGTTLSRPAGESIAHPPAAAAAAPAVRAAGQGRSSAPAPKRVRIMK